MYELGLRMIRRTSGSLTLAAVTFCLAAVAHSQATAAGDAPTVGRIDFESAKLPEANVEVDLSQDMFKDLFGIGDAAVAGVAETLLKSTNSGEGARGVRMAAEQLESARQIMQLAGDVVREVRVRVYESLPDDAGGAQKLFAPFDEQLRAGKWETLAKVHDDENVVRVSAIRSGGSIQGIFVTATDGDSVVIANIVCDVSPENVKKLTSSATKVGLANGLAQAIESKMKRQLEMMGSHPTIVIRTAGEKAPRSANIPAPPVPAPPAPPAAAAQPAESATQ
jgi:hypothetical protein